MPIPAPIRAIASVRRGFTLAELTAVLGIVAVLSSMGMAGVAAAMRQSAADSGRNILQGVATGLVRRAQIQGNAGIVYGFSILYSTTVVTTADYVTGMQLRVIPWSVTPPAGATKTGDLSGVTIAGWTSSDQLAAVMTVGGDMVSEGGVMCYRLPAAAAVASYFTAPQTLANMQTGAVSTATAMASNSYIHVCFEPVTGFVHWTTGAGSPIGQGLASIFAGATSVQNLVALPSSALECNLHNLPRSRKESRFILYAYGSNEVRSCRD